MRKRYKNKKRACSLCKPHKREWAKHLKPKDLQQLKEDEHDMRENTKYDLCDK